MIVQKLRLDKELTNNVQVVVRDETGLYSTSNPGGYGGGVNGNPPSKFEKYILELINLYTNTTYRQIQSDNINNPNEQHIPSIENIVNKDNILIDSDTFNLINFEDGIYKLYMNIQISDIYSGSGMVNAEVINAVNNAQYIYDTYKAIIVGTQIYQIQEIAGNTLILDRPIVASFNSFKPLLRTSVSFILSDKLNECLNSGISKFADGCTKNVNTLNVLSELQLYQWGIHRAIDRNDFAQAYEYFTLSKNLCSTLGCGCHG